MSRKKRDFKRIVLADPRYGDVVVGKAINVIMDSGKKGVAERALYGALDAISKKTGADAWFEKNTKFSLILRILTGLSFLITLPHISSMAKDIAEKLAS